MSDSAKETSEDVEYVEAEIASLKEELVGLPVPPPARRAFVHLRISRLEKELPKLTDRQRKAREHEEWLAKMGQSR